MKRRDGSLCGWAFYCVSEDGVCDFRVIIGFGYLRI